MESFGMTRDDLQKFCADDESRYNILVPWSAGEWTYATNGHIIVRVPRLADVDENTKAPNAEALFAKSQQTDFVPVPECSMPKPIPCDLCGGSGKVREGREQVECYYCDGVGHTPRLDGIKIGNATYQKHYLALIQGWDIAPNGKNAAWIRNSEATGLLMPRRDD